MHLLEVTGFPPVTQTHGLWIYIDGTTHQTQQKTTDMALLALQKKWCFSPPVLMLSTSGD